MRNAWDDRLGVGGVWVVAEAGVNHDGDVGKAVEMVSVAAACGADAVKFQVFTAEGLTAGEAKTASYQRAACGAVSQRAMLERLELSDSDLARVAARCGEERIGWVATPFTIGDVDRVVQLGVDVIKIASTDIVDRGLLEGVFASGRPVIVSTGAASEVEVDEAVELAGKAGGRDRLALLHCVSCYPTPVGRVNLRRIETLRGRFGLPVGFSDHSTSVESGAWAVCAGARMLEKHFTLDGRAEGPDHAMSLEPENLKRYVGAAREAAEAMGDGRMEPQEIELEVRARARKRVVAARAIAAGERLTEAMLTTKRADRGAEAWLLREFVGRRAVRDIAADGPVERELVK